MILNFSIILFVVLTAIIGFLDGIILKLGIDKVYILLYNISVDKVYIPSLSPSGCCGCIGNPRVVPLNGSHRSYG